MFALSACLLVLEIAVARVLSVALYSHYAFVAISLAMFGLGLSGLLAYLMPSRFPAASVDRQVSQYAALFGVAAAVAVLAFLQIHVVQELSWRGFLTLSVAYGVLAIPFLLGGLCISLLMTHFSAAIGRLYFADLAGAGVGCFLVVLALNVATAPHVALCAALVATLVSIVVARASGNRARTASYVATAICTAVLLVATSTGLSTMRYVKSWEEYYSTHESWNAFSRVSAFDVDANAAQIVPLKDRAERYAAPTYPPTMMLDIDGMAWTPMMHFDGDLSSIQFLRESVLYAAHSIKPQANVLIIGTGGGRDLLAARVFDQSSILGIEINPLMHRLVEEVYGEYSGHPYTDGGVEVVVDEARSHLASLQRSFDIIQLSLIDTFSLNAAGGFVFSENYLYTEEAFEEYFDHLTDDGVLSLTRYFVPRYPLEVLRLATMARAAWESRGVSDFARHTVVLKQGVNATMLVKKSPFTDEDLAGLSDLVRRNKMEILYSPRATHQGHREIREVMASRDWRAYVAGYPFLIDPPVDDRPFFFNYLRSMVDVPELKDDPFEFLRKWNDALILMYMLLTVVGVMAVTFFLLPLLVLGRRAANHVPASVAAPLLLYFACLGYGFLMIEIPLLQRLVLFLGHPVYALAVVLFALLTFSGLGSLLSSTLTGDATVHLRRVLACIVILALAYVFALPPVVQRLLGLSIELKIATTVVLLAPIGLVLGMAYPLGITVLRRFGEELVPWAWGLNGALSVVASVLATFIGSRLGFTAAMMTGVGAYALALVLIMIATRTSVRHSH